MTAKEAENARRGRMAVAAMFAVNGFLMGSWAPQIPFMLPRHQITETTLGLLILLFGVGAMAAMPWTGGLIHRHGSRKVVRGFALIASLSLAAVVLSPNLWTVAPMLMLMGGFVGCMDVSMNANAVEVEKQLGRAIMSSSHGFWSLGGFFGGAIGGPLIALLGPEGHALAATVLALAAVLAALPFLVNEASHDADGRASEKPGWPKAPIIYLIGMLALFSMLPEGAVLDWSALYLSKELGAGVSASGLAFAAFSAAMAAMRFLGDGIRNRFGAVRTLRWSGAIAALGMLAGGLAETSLTVTIAFAIAGLGIANTVPIAFSAAGNQKGIAAGAGLSVVTMIGYSGILAGPSLIGFVGERIGFAPVYLAVAGLLAIVSLMAGAVSAADSVKAQNAA